MLKIIDIKSYLLETNVPFINDVNGITLDLKITSSSGKRKLFILNIQENSGSLIVYERSSFLPKFCPNRHINTDSSFCLGISSHISVESWFKDLKEFLRAQLFCDQYKKWPIQYGEWSHGDAAHYQRNVEFLLKKINLKNLKINLNDLTLNKIKHPILQEDFFHVYHKNVLIIVGSENKVYGKRDSCICTKNGRYRHVTKGKCPHKCAAIILEIVINEDMRVKKEIEFWEYLKDKKLTCCQTMKKCELK